MGFEYVNRMGDRYFLLEGKTKTGKPKYYMSRKGKGLAVETIPEGFEVREDPATGIVTLRRVRETSILPEERERLTALMRELSGLDFFMVDVEEDSLVIYTPTRSLEDSHELMARFGLFGHNAAKLRQFITSSQCTAMMRFSLVDPQRRRFTAARWCFRGAIDGWLPLAGPDSLEVHARKLLPHIAKESFFELI